jgi:hypothetical protein
VKDAYSDTKPMMTQKYRTAKCTASCQNTFSGNSTTAETVKRPMTYCSTSNNPARGLKADFFCFHVTGDQLSAIIKDGSLCEELKELDKVTEICFDEWYGPYIYVMVQNGDDQLFVRIDNIIADFLNRKGATSNPTYL